MESKNVLVVEDDVVFAATLKKFLEKNGFSVTHLADGTETMTQVEMSRPDAIILDGILPSIDGLHLCRELRPRFTGPILMLTARDEDLDELLGLELGADDYITKPAEPRLVLARLKACLRRTNPAPSSQKDKLHFGALLIDHGSRSVTLDNQPLVLSTAEFDLLWLLASQAGHILSREDIFRATRGLEYDGLDRSIDMRISRLRKLIGDDTDNPEIIKTVRGKGYLFSMSPKM